MNAQRVKTCIIMLDARAALQQYAQALPCTAPLTLPELLQSREVGEAMRRLHAHMR